VKVIYAGVEVSRKEGKKKKKKNLWESPITIDETTCLEKLEMSGE